MYLKYNLYFSNYFSNLFSVKMKNIICRSESMYMPNVQLINTKNLSILQNIINIDCHRAIFCDDYESNKPVITPNTRLVLNLLPLNNIVINALISEFNEELKEYTILNNNTASNLNINPTSLYAITSCDQKIYLNYDDKRNDLKYINKIVIDNKTSEPVYCIVIYDKKYGKNTCFINLVTIKINLSISYLSFNFKTVSKLVIDHYEQYDTSYDIIWTKIV